jgi:hypothetical protein
MSRPPTRAQALENQAFLRNLRRSGNARDAARAVGKAYGTMQHRRRTQAAFAAEWAAALAMAQARLARAGGPARPEGRAAEHATAEDPRALRTRGGEAHVVLRPDGTLQLRRAHPNKLTRGAEQAFLSALSATANVRLSAAAAGASEAAFYRRKRRNPAFAREWRLALEQGYEAVETALLAGFAPDSALDDAWRHNEPPATPPMTADQALQLLYLHQKEARLQAEPPHLRRRRGETTETQQFRLSAMWRAQMEREREAFRIGEAARAEGRQASPHELPPPVVPDLAQVTGWSRENRTKEARDPGRALFGGWRIEDMEEKERRGR